MKFTTPIITLLPLLVAVTQAAPVCRPASDGCEVLQARQATDADVVEGLFSRATPKRAPPKKAAAAPKPAALRIPPFKKPASAPKPPAPLKRSASLPLKPQRAPAGAKKPAARPALKRAASFTAKKNNVPAKPKPQLKRSATLPIAKAAAPKSPSPLKRSATLPPPSKLAPKPKTPAPVAPKRLSKWELGQTIKATQQARNRRQEALDRGKKKSNADMFTAKKLNNVAVPAARAGSDPKKRNDAIAKNAQLAGQRSRLIQRTRAANKLEKSLNKGWTPDGKKKMVTSQFARKKAVATSDKARASLEKEEKKAMAAAAAAPKSKPKVPKLNDIQRAQVANAFRKAAAQKNAVKDLPARSAKFKVGNDKEKAGANTWSGKDVRQGIYNSKVYDASHPVAAPGSAHNALPKPFNNSPYAPTHGNPALRNQPAIPAPGYTNGKEYPIKSGSKVGWNGAGDVGPGRVITYDSAAGKNNWAVVGHDLKAGGDANDHYLAKTVA